MGILGWIGKGLLKVVRGTGSLIWEFVFPKAKRPRISREEALNESALMLAERKSMRECVKENPYEVSDEEIGERYDELKKMGAI